MTIAELRAYLDEYAQTFDETVKTRIDSERFLAWLEKRMAEKSGEAALDAEAAAAVAAMMDADQAVIDNYQPSAPAAEGANG